MTSTSDGQTKWWTVRQLAAYYALSPRMIYEAIARSELAVHRFGDRRAMRISDEDRQAWEQNRRSAGRRAAEQSVVPTERLRRPQLVAKHFQR
jgi:excisionase family DNA binding protein